MKPKKNICTKQLNYLDENNISRKNEKQKRRIGIDRVCTNKNTEHPLPRNMTISDLLATVHTSFSHFYRH